MLKAREVEAGGSGWTSRRGELQLWTPTETVLVVQMRGHGEGEFARLILERFNTLARTDDADVFVEMEWMASYDSALRTDLTDSFRRARLRRIHVFSRSKIVNMGVAVANVALGNIKTYPNRTDFTDALDRCVGRRGAATFTALAGLSNTTRWSAP